MGLDVFMGSVLWSLFAIGMTIKHAHTYTVSVIKGTTHFRQARYMCLKSLS